MKDRTLKQYNPEDIEKIYTKNNKNKLPSQFNEDYFYANAGPVTIEIPIKRSKYTKCFARK